MQTKVKGPGRKAGKTRYILNWRYVLAVVVADGLLWATSRIFLVRRAHLDGSSWKSYAAGPAWFPTAPAPRRGEGPTYLGDKAMLSSIPRSDALSDPADCV